ncbi:MAG: tyrosine-type recombinase/integrase, partial [Nostoc sp.]
LPHYRQRSLIRLEKEANLKGYVDMYGRVTSFKPRKTRYEKLANLLKVSTPLGECHRPTMLGDCQHRYACLSCPHHRITPEDKSQLEADLNYL